MSISQHMKHLISKYKKIQSRASRAALENIRQGNPALIVLPTGEGKTHTAINILQGHLKNKPKARVLWICSADKILDESLETVQRRMPKLAVGRFDSSDRDTDSQLILASIWTLARGKNLKEFKRNAFDIAIYDEAHRAASLSYQKTLTYFDAIDIAMTATPGRADGKDITEHFGPPVITRTVAQGMKEGTLAKDESWVILTNSVLKPVVLNNEEYSPQELDRLFASKDRNRIIIQATKDYGKGRCKELGLKFKAICFCRTQAHAKAMSKRFNRAKFRSNYIIGDTTKLTGQSAVARERIYNQFKKSHDIEIICVVDTLGEGVDIPDVTCLIMARPTRSSSKYLQQFGRGTRRMVKKHFVVLDFVDNISREYQPYTASTATKRSLPKHRVIVDYLDKPDPIVVKQRIEDATMNAEKWQSRVTIDPDRKKKELIELAKSGAPRPLTRTELGYALANYLQKDGSSYDPLFRSQIIAERPDWQQFRWTEVACIKEAQKYKQTTTWKSANGSSYAAALRLGIIDKCTFHMKKRKVWTLTECLTEAQKYQYRAQWIRAGGGSYSTASRHGWVKKCISHMVTGLGFKTSRPVINLETRQIYNSMSAAQRAIGIKGLHQAITRRRTCGGYHWAYYNPKKHAHLVKKNSKKAA